MQYKPIRKNPPYPVQQKIKYRIAGTLLLTLFACIGQASYASPLTYHSTDGITAAGNISKQLKQRMDSTWRNTPYTIKGKGKKIMLPAPAEEGYWIYVPEKHAASVHSAADYPLFFD